MNLCRSEVRHAAKRRFRETCPTGPLLRADHDKAQGIASSAARRAATR